MGRMISPAKKERNFSGKLLTIDSGEPEGLALWFDRKLVAAGQGTPGKHVIRVDLAVFEIPDHHKKGSIFNLSMCAARGGITAAWCSDVVMPVTPRVWKSGRPKHITEADARAALTQEELEKVTSNSTHCWDSIGIGLWFLGRLY